MIFACNTIDRRSARSSADTHLRLLALVGAHFAAIVFLGIAVSADASDDVPPDYAKQIAPLLTKYCAGCHDAENHEGDFVLDNYQALDKGGKHGPAVLAGDAAASRMYRSIARQAEPFMPPEDSPQPKAEEVALIKAWIDAGAKGPAGAELDRKQLIVPKIKSAAKQEPITALAWSTDGKRLAVARYGKVELCDPASKQVVHTLGDHPGKISSLAFSSDGKWLVTGAGVPGLFSEVRLWNVETQKVERTFDGHRDMVYGVALSRDGKRLATGSYDRRAILWDVDTGKPIHTLEGHNGAIYDVAFSPDAKLLATASGDATVKIWNVGTGERLDTLSQPTKEQFSATFSPDGELILAGGADNRLRVWTLTSRDKPATNAINYVRYAHEGPVINVLYSPDGTLLATVGDDRTIKLWDLDSFTQIHVFPVQPDSTPAVAFSPDGRQLAVGRMNGSLDVLTVPKKLGRPAASSAEVAKADAPMVTDAPMTKTAEIEPNDEPKSATQLPLPGVVEGIIDVANSGRSHDVDLFRIACRRGEQWVLETRAAQDNSPLDSKLDVRDADGKPVPRMLLAAVRDSYIHFRGIDGNDRDVRMFGWEEMDIGQYFYFQGEVCKSFRMPQGPDSGMSMFPHGGSRFAYFDTTSMAHAMGEPCYVVEPLPPDATPVPNGLPVFKLNYENDDDGFRRFGKDSRLTFTAPADGQYLVRVSDVRGFHGPEYKYQLTGRPLKPDFTAKIGGRDPKIAAGSGKAFTVEVDRADDFEGEVRFELMGDLPPGINISSPLVVQPGLYQAEGVVFANRNAEQPTPAQLEQLKLRAVSRIGGREVAKEVGTLGKIKLEKQPKITVRLVPDSATKPDFAAEPTADQEIVLEAGKTMPARLFFERDGFNDRLNVDLNNLPFGVIVANLGLNGLMVPAKETEWQFHFDVAPWTPESICWIHAVARAEGNQASPPIKLRIVRAKAPQTEQLRSAKTAD
jgi:hypothetical protein